MNTFCWLQMDDIFLSVCDAVNVNFYLSIIILIFFRFTRVQLSWLCFFRWQFIATYIFIFIYIFLYHTLCSFESIINCWQWFVIWAYFSILYCDICKCHFVAIFIHQMLWHFIFSSLAVLNTMNSLLINKIVRILSIFENLLLSWFMML